MVNQIAIIIPTYNEEKNIERLIKNIKLYVGNVLIIVVDDSGNNKSLIFSWFKPIIMTRIASFFK